MVANLVKRTTIIFLFALILVMVTSFLSKPLQSGLVTIGGKTIKVAVARTPREREKGFSGQIVLPEGTGMLFIFEKPGDYGFWMKDMNFPIDIIWIGQNSKIVEISSEVSPSTFPKTFSPKAPILYVLEVKAGWSGRNKILVDESVQFAL